jgi:hypothetical protein
VNRYVSTYKHPGQQVEVDALKITETLMTEEQTEFLSFTLESGEIVQGEALRAVRYPAADVGDFLVTFPGGKRYVCPGDVFPYRFTASAAVSQ